MSGVFFRHRQNSSADDSQVQRRELESDIRLLVDKLESPQAERVSRQRLNDGQMVPRAGGLRLFGGLTLLTRRRIAKGNTGKYRAHPQVLGAERETRLFAESCNADAAEMLRAVARAATSERDRCNGWRTSAPSRNDDIWRGNNDLVVQRERCNAPPLPSPKSLKFRGFLQRRDRPCPKKRESCNARVSDQRVLTTARLPRCGRDGRSRTPVSLIDSFASG